MHISKLNYNIYLPCQKCQPFWRSILYIININSKLWLSLKSFLRSVALYLCSGMYGPLSSLRNWKQLELVNCLTASLPRNNLLAELCSGIFNEAYCRDPEWKLPTPPPILIKHEHLTNKTWSTGTNLLGMKAKD
jgi:hypothetical protein